ncbi:MAG: flagellar biosynthetic protein FliO [Bryobacteraceae bacterium]
MDVAEGDFIRQGLAVLVVFALLGAAVWKLRGGPLLLSRSERPRLASIGRLALTPQHAVHLLRIDGREMVVATHPQGCSVLNEVSESRKASA